MRAAILDGNTVINIVMVESLDDIPGSLDAEGAKIGDRYENGTFVTPEPDAPVPPNSVSMRQARLQLLALGVYDQINSAISTMSQAAQIEWEYATEVQRDNPLVAGIQQLLGWTDGQLDTYFIEAGKL